MLLNNSGLYLMRILRNGSLKNLLRLTCIHHFTLILDPSYWFHGFILSYAASATMLIDGIYSQNTRTDLLKLVSSCIILHLTFGWNLLLKLVSSLILFEPEPNITVDLGWNQLRWRCIAIVDLSQIVRGGPYLHDSIKEGLQCCQIFFLPYEMVGGIWC